MATRYYRKPFYRLDEICERWGMLPADFEPFVLANELRLSVAVVSLRVDQGTWEEVDLNDWYRMPDGMKYLTGVADLHGDDAWSIPRQGRHPVGRFVAEPGRYLDVDGTHDSEVPFEVCKEDLVLRHAELERFESVQADAMTNVAIQTAEIVALPAQSRGAQATHDWDAFWVEMCRTLYFEGVPPTQLELVHRQQDWFAKQGRKVPDESTIKKKLKPLWQLFLPEAQRKSA